MRQPPSCHYVTSFPQRGQEKQMTPHLPFIKVLYMSGYTDKTIDHDGVLEPDLAFIQKPFFLSDFIKKVRNVLDE